MQRSSPAVFDEGVRVRPIPLVGEEQLERSEVAGGARKVDGALPELGVEGLGVRAGLQEDLQR